MARLKFSLAFLVISASVPLIPIEMEKYEYLNIKKVEINDLDHILNFNGLQGWKLIFVVPGMEPEKYQVGNIPKFKIVYQLIFERKINE